MSLPSASLGVWTSADERPAFGQADILRAVARVRETLYVVRDPAGSRLGVSFGGQMEGVANGTPSFPIVSVLAPLFPEWLGDRSFGEVHGVRFPYVVGEMANGIATSAMVVAAARAGGLGFFGSAGLDPDRIERAIEDIEQQLVNGESWGMNLIHSPNEPALEEATADLFIRRGVKRVSASAFMGLTPSIVRYALTGCRSLADGRVERRHHVFAKISRPEVARRFMEPAPADMLDALVAKGLLTAEEGRLGRLLPVAEDFTVESDSGGHTDNRPLGALFPTIQLLRDQVMAQRNYARPIRLGAAGGLGTPASVASAFALGAAFVLTGSVNQACVESGLHPLGRVMLCQAGLADVVMAPAADMFELGVEVQVLQRGTMFAARASRLYDLYKTYPSLDAIPGADRERLEKEILRESIGQAWEATKAYWTRRDAAEVDKAMRDPKHQMALVFRAYLGQSSKWAIAGDGPRKVDYQIWCGPAMGAFNQWVKGTFLEPPEARTVGQVLKNLLEGAAVVTRAQTLRSCGVPVPPTAFDFRPRPLQ